MKSIVTARFNSTELEALDRLPGVNRTEKLKNAVLHQQVTAAIAKAVAAEISKAQEPVRDLMITVGKLREDVHSLDLASRATMSRAASATLAVEQLAERFETRLAERDDALGAQLTARDQKSREVATAIRDHLAAIYSRLQEGR